MNMNLEAFQGLLARMRGEFIGELAERCERLDDLILNLEKSPDKREIFDELYRGVHSLKGSGGTHGLSIITTICHQLENLITGADEHKAFGSAFATRAFPYVDLLRRVEEIARQDKPDYSFIEADLETLRQSGLQSRKSVLIAELSSTMAGFYKQVLAGLPLQVGFEDNGLTALERLLHESFDLVIVGREIKELNGIAMMAALRHSQSSNHDIPAILISSKRDEAPNYIGFKASIARDQNLADNLLAAVDSILPS